MILTRKKVAVTAVGIVAAALVGNQLGGGDADAPLTVVAVFADASPLVAGNVVKASGIEVGKITDVSLQEGKARVEMKIDRDVLPLHEDVKATITTQDLLGERFVDLDRGTADAPPLDEPMVIGEKQTARVVDLQDVLNSVDTPTSTALAALVTGAGEGLEGHGEQTDAAVAALAPAMTQARDLAAILADQNALLTRLVDSAQPVASALASDPDSLGHLVTTANTSLSELASQRQALAASLTALPGTILSARSTLSKLAGVAGPTTATLESIRPLTDNLSDVSGELEKFAAAADPALASLPPVLEHADKLLREAAPVAAALRPASGDLVPTSNALDQITSHGVSGKNLTNLMEFVKGWSMATSDYDAISHYFKAMLPLSPSALGDTVAGVVPLVPDDVLDGLPVPTAPKLPQQGRGDVAPPAGVDPDSATGLSEAQENGLVQQLIGGLL